MKKIIVVGLALTLGACANQYGQVDPIGTAAVGAAIGGVTGLVGGAALQSQQGYYRPGYYAAPAYYAPPRPWAPSSPPYAHYGPPRYYYPRYGY